MKRGGSSGSKTIGNKRKIDEIKENEEGAKAQGEKTLKVRIRAKGIQGSSNVNALRRSPGK